MISIVLPTYNSARFLEERLASIEAQTFRDWEVVAVDGCSTDGTWERLRAFGLRHPRVRLLRQEPRGAYPAWNLGIRQAAGEFVHVATADDTMAPDFLEKTAAALRARPECGLAQTGLRVIDADGAAVSGPQSWEEQPAAKFFLKEWIDRPHLRPAPYDGLLHSLGATVYTSVNQLLVRRAVFERTGAFRAEWGGIGDFEWGMRTALVHGVVYLPGRLASWRRHPGQLTSDARNASAAAKREMAAMVRRAWSVAAAAAPGLGSRLSPSRLTRPLRHQALAFERPADRGRSAALRLRQWFREPDTIAFDWKHRYKWKRRGYVYEYQEEWAAWVRGEIARLGLPGPLPAEGQD